MNSHEFYNHNINLPNALKIKFVIKIFTELIFPRALCFEVISEKNIHVVYKTKTFEAQSSV